MGMSKMQLLDVKSGTKAAEELQKSLEVNRIICDIR